MGCISIAIEQVICSVNVKINGGGAVVLSVFGTNSANLVTLLTGETGPQGPQGPQGAMGQQGAMGPAGLGFVTPDKQRGFHKFKTPGLISNWNATGLTTTPLRLVACMCRMPSHGDLITRLEMQVGAAASGAIGHVGIYSVGAAGDFGGMSEILLSSAAIDMSTTGVKQSTLSTPVIANGSLIVLAFLTNAACGVKNFIDTKMYQMQLSIYDNYSESARYVSVLSNTLPAQLPAMSSAISISAVPLVGFGVA